MNKRMRTLINQQHGVVLITVLLVSLLLTFVGLSIAELVMNQYARTNTNVFNANAYLVAEAGAEQSLYEINEDSTFTGYTDEAEFFDNGHQGRATYETSVSAGSGPNEKVIVSTGRVYRQGHPDQPVSTRSVRVTIVGTSSPGYAVHTGVGGLILGGSANITNAQVFVNGGITMTGTAKIGTAAAPLTVNVANQRCPSGNNPGPTYPQVCATGQPISMAWSTAIYGSVCATRQTSTSPSGNPAGNILPGNGGTGLVPNCTTAPTPMPTYDRTAHIASMTTTQAGNSNNVVCNSWPFIRTWPANLRMTGNVTVSSSCEVTIHGNVYISGNFDLSGAAKITVAEGVGTTRPIVVVDGKITIGGSARIIANSHGTVKPRWLSVRFIDRSQSPR